MFTKFRMMGKPQNFLAALSLQATDALGRPFCITPTILLGRFFSSVALVREHLAHFFAVSRLVRAQ
jgi:hypothetical protein